MQLDRSILKLVSLMSPESCKLQMVAKAFRLSAAENYRHRVCARRLFYTCRFISMVFYMTGTMDGPFLKYGRGCCVGWILYRLYRLGDIMVVLWDEIP